MCAFQSLLDENSHHVLPKNEIDKGSKEKLQAVKIKARC